MESNDDTKLANIGDATLVNSSDIVDNNVTSNEVKEQQENYTSKTDTISTSNNENNSDDYFVKSKLERDTMYSQMIETYEKVLNSNNSLETQKQTATQEITKINETKNSIMISENLLKTKGFDNNIIFVNGQSISIIVGTQELKQEEVAQIQNIVSREMKAQIENIHISTK